MRTGLRAFAALSVVLAVFVTLAPAAHAQTPPSPPSVPPSFADPRDDVLRRLLRSNCRDGLAEARALATAGAVPWAETTVRLCGEIIAARPATALRETLSRGEREGRGTIVVWSTIYGIWAGIAVDVLASIDGARSAIVAPLLGMGAGLGLSLSLSSDHPLTNGQAWTIVTGLQYGSFNGALWGGGFDLSTKDNVTTTLATGLASGVVGLLVASKLDPAQGDVEIVRSGLLWGTAAGMLAMWVASPNGSSRVFLRGAGAAMDLGFLGGLALAATFDVSRNRDLIIDAGTLGGGVAGLGLAALATGVSGHGQAVAAGGLVGLAAGMLTTIYLTRGLDARDDEGDAPVAALLGRNERGHWLLGTPGATPVLDGLGQRIIGATFTAVGGAL